MEEQTSQRTNGSNILLRVSRLKKYFPIEKGFLRRTTGYIRAVDDISFDVMAGETLGIVGESGSGKTTLGRCIVGAYPLTSGSIHIRPERSSKTMVDFTSIKGKELRTLRTKMNMIFQDPFSSLDPRWTILDIISEPMRHSRLYSRREIEDRVRDLLNLVGLNVSQLKNYPHAFSGGQRQRIGIARALATNPNLIIADEPVSALDVSIQAQILNLITALQKEFNLTTIFIAHNLSVVEHISDRIGVMYVGKMVEMASKDAIFTRPRHPYTEALFSAVPSPDPFVKKKRIILPGEVPNPANPPTGCYFHPRCRYAIDKCVTDAPVFEEVEKGHFAACHRAHELNLEGVVRLENGNYEKSSPNNLTPTAGE
jgi:peptide/nickel transport system ATP-binding protein